MKIKNLILGAFVVGLLSVLYNYGIFSLFNFYPDLSFEIGILGEWGLNYYFIIFVKNFLVGLLLMYLFFHAYNNIVSDNGEAKYMVKGIIFFVLYSLVALLSFSFGDMIMMKSQEGMLILLTVDGFIETLIATIPIRFFSV